MLLELSPRPFVTLTKELANFTSITTDAFSVEGKLGAARTTAVRSTPWRARRTH